MARDITPPTVEPIRQPRDFGEGDVRVVRPTPGRPPMDRGRDRGGRSDTLPVEDWDTFFTAETTALYLPLQKQVVFLKDAGGSSNGDIYIFDIPTRSWVSGDSIFVDSRAYTNAVIDSSGNTVVFDNNTTYKQWTSTDQASSTIQATFKDLTFGSEGITKKVYRVVVQYKSSVSQSTPLKYATDGGGSFSSFGTQSFSSSSSWTRTVFLPSSAVSCESIQFRIDPPSSGTIEIDNIAITYRILPFARVS